MSQAPGRDVDGCRQAATPPFEICNGTLCYPFGHAIDEASLLSKWDESIRRQESELRMLPFDQCLDGRDSSIVQADLWLIEQHQFIFIDGVPELGHQGQVCRVVVVLR